MRRQPKELRRSSCVASIVVSRVKRRPRALPAAASTYVFVLVLIINHYTANSSRLTLTHALRFVQRHYEYDPRIAFNACSYVKK